MATNKKIWIFSIVILTLVISLIVINQSGRESYEPIKIGVLARSFHTLPLFIAEEKGFFEKQGIAVNLIDLEAGIRNTALLTGDIDYHFSVPDGAQAWREGANLKTIMGYFPEGIPNSLVVQPHLELSEVRTIGVALPYISMHYTALKIIEKNNLAAEIIFTGPGAIPSLLVRREIDAGVQSMLPALKLEGEGFSIQAEIIDIISVSGLVATEKKINHNPEEITKVIAAVQETVVFIKNNSQETKELLSQLLDLEENERGREKAEKIYVALKENLSAEGIISEEAQEMIIKYAKAGAYETLEDIEQQIVTKEEMLEFFNFDFLRR